MFPQRLRLETLAFSLEPAWGMPAPITTCSTEVTEVIRPAVLKRSVKKTVKKKKGFSGLGEIGMIVAFIGFPAGAVFLSGFLAGRWSRR